MTDTSQRERTELGKSGHEGLPEGSDGTGGASAGDSAPVADPWPATPHLLRDLDRRGRLWAAAFAGALLLAPVLAFVGALPRWAPAGDPAFMAIQSLDVGTRDTPLTGQPSTSALYVGGGRHVDHLGPAHLYLMAVPIRLLGPTAGMLAVSLAVVSASLLLMAWVTYRRLGPLGGATGAVVIGLITFTTGAAGLMNPVSSHFAGYPLYCSALLLWCVMRGDVRLLPLATAVTAFAAQQHLSVLPTVAVLVPAGLGGLLYYWGRDGRWREKAARRHLLAWAGPSAGIGLLLWSPMLLQQVVGQPGNLAHLVRLTLHGDRPTLGLTSAVDQMTHVLGLPPVLGRLDLTGLDLIVQVPALTRVSAGLVVVALAALAWWWRRAAPERSSLVLMAGLLVVAGLVNGSSVLDSVEAWRLVLYHWAFPLAFFAILALVLGAIDIGREALARRYVRLPSRALRPAAASGALLAIVVPAVVNPSLDRPPNELYALSAPLEREYIEELANQVLEHRDDLEGPLLLAARGHRTFSSLGEALGLQLLYAGIDVRFPRSERHYVPDGRLVDADHEGGGLLLVHDTSTNWHPVEVGELIADVFTVEDVDFDTYNAKAELLEATEQYRFSPSLRQLLESLPEPLVDAAERGEMTPLLEDPDFQQEHNLTTPTAEQVEAFWKLTYLDALHRDPYHHLADAGVLDLLLEHPLEEPELDPGILMQLRESDLGAHFADRSLRVRVYLLDHDDLLELADEWPPLSGEVLTEHIGEDAPVPVVSGFGRGVEPHGDRHLDRIGG